MSVLPNGIVLPEDARLDLSFRDARHFGPHPFASVWQYIADGAYCDAPLSISVQYTTDATPGNRTVTLTHNSVNAGVLWDVPAAAALAPGGTYSLTWAIDVTALGSIANALLSPLPPIALIPPEALQMQAFGAGPADVFPAPSIVVVRVPTGPARIEQPAVPTPLLV